MRDPATSAVAEPIESSSGPPSSSSRSLFPIWLRKVLIGIVALFFFVLALELLKKGAKPLGPFLTDTLGIRNATNTLGFGW